MEIHVYSLQTRKHMNTQTQTYKQTQTYTYMHMIDTYKIYKDKYVRIYKYT